MNSVLVVRRMLLDSEPLIYQVNKKLRLKIKFHVRDTGDHDSVMADIFRRYDAIDVDASFDPELGADGPTSKVNLDSFLKIKVVKLSNGKFIDVRGVIDYVAHVAGAVHKGKAITEEHIQLERLIQMVSSESDDFTNLRIVILHMFRSIIAVTFRAVEPILDRLLGEKRSMFYQQIRF